MTLQDKVERFSFKFTKGDIDVAFDKSPYFYENTLDTGSQYTRHT